MNPSSKMWLVQCKVRNHLRGRQEADGQSPNSPIWRPCLFSKRSGITRYEIIKDPPAPRSKPRACRVRMMASWEITLVSCKNNSDITGILQVKRDSMSSLPSFTNQVSIGSCGQKLVSLKHEWQVQLWYVKTWVFVQQSKIQKEQNVLGFGVENPLFSVCGNVKWCCHSRKRDGGSSESYM